MRRTIGGYHNFAECVIEEVIWKERELALEMLLTYVWTDDGLISYTAGTQPRLARLRFWLVQEISIRNALNTSMVAHPEKVNWGASEIARFSVDADSEFLQPYHDFARAFFHGEFLWEWDRRIDLVFAELSVSVHEAIGPVERNRKQSP